MPVLQQHTYCSGGGRPNLPISTQSVKGKSKLCQSHSQIVFNVRCIAGIKRMDGYQGVDDLVGFLYYLIPSFDRSIVG